MGFRTKTILWKPKWEVVMLKTKTKQSSHWYQKQFNTLSGGIKQIFCCQGEKENKKSEGEQKKGQKKKKTGKTPGSCVQNNEEHYPGLVDHWKSLFPWRWQHQFYKPTFPLRGRTQRRQSCWVEEKCRRTFAHYEESRTICNGCVWTCW